MSTHSKAAAKFIADADRTAWHDKALYAVREKRDKMARTVPEWEDLRRMSSEIKRKVIGYARKSRQKKIKRKPFEMSIVSVFCQIEKMQMTT